MQALDQPRSVLLLELQLSSSAALSGASSWIVSQFRSRRFAGVKIRPRAAIRYSPRTSRLLTAATASENRDGSHRFAMSIAPFLEQSDEMLALGLDVSLAQRNNQNWTTLALPVA